MGRQKKSVNSSSKMIKSKPIHKKYTKDDCTFSINKLQTGKQHFVIFPTFRNNEGKLEIMIPKYRNNGMCFTSGFCNPQQTKIEQNFKNGSRFLHQNFQIPVDQIMIPKPSPHNSYCTICKFCYQDYLQHIKLDSHIFKMKQSSFSQEIAKFSELYTLRNRKQVQIVDQDEEKRQSLEEKQRKKNNFDGKEKLYYELKEQIFKSTQDVVEKEQQIFDVIL